jgi:DNA modification methylase
MKPVALYERSIRNHSRHGEQVLELFGGSGTTLVASEITGRRARLVEIEPRFCDVIRQRYADLVGEPEWAPQ